VSIDAPVFVSWSGVPHVTTSNVVKLAFFGPSVSDQLSVPCSAGRMSDSDEHKVHGLRTD
jgi:hypothetical protein